MKYKNTSASSHSNFGGKAAETKDLEPVEALMICPLGD